ncbi:hypothetical protein [Streptomyces angustmyceticus]|uniref:hypothetical protein n=1 Tax=Streptomyces angustmyceticus TaxID=285578 RepID=UPI00344CE6FA
MTALQLRQQAREAAEQATGDLWPDSGFVFRTCGSLLAALDGHPRIAMQILRHSKIAVTMEICTHVPSESTRKALRKLGKHLGNQAEPT